jgi:hypothetical protein
LLQKLTLVYVGVHIDMLNHINRALYAHPVSSDAFSRRSLTRYGATPLFLTADQSTGLERLDKVLLASCMNRMDRHYDKLASLVVAKQQRESHWRPTVGVAASSKLQEPLTVLLTVMDKMRAAGIEPAGKHFPKIVCLDLDPVQKSNRDKTILLGKSELDFIRAKGFSLEEVLEPISPETEGHSLSPKLVSFVPDITNMMKNAAPSQVVNQEHSPQTGKAAVPYMNLDSYKPGLHLVVKPTHMIRAMQQEALTWADLVHEEEQHLYKIKAPYADALHLVSGSVLEHPVIRETPFWTAHNLLGYLPGTKEEVAQKLHHLSSPNTHWFINWSKDAGQILTSEGFRLHHQEPATDPRVKAEHLLSGAFEQAYHLEA